MTHDRLAPLMGVMLGGMIPLMVHGSMGGIGLAFVMAHVAVGAVLLGLILLVPPVRIWAARYRPTPRMGLRMGGAAVAGFVVICAHCLLTLHGGV